MIVVELGNCRLRIDKKAFQELLSFVQDSKEKPESGGILIGLYIDKYSIVISEITKPTEYDKKSRFSFNRSVKSIKNIILDKFKSSKGKKIYMGEWHSHPENYPHPSSTDLDSFLIQLNQNKLNSDILIMLIVGIKGMYFGVYNKTNLISGYNVNYNDIKM